MCVHYRVKKMQSLIPFEDLDSHVIHYNDEPYVSLIHLGSVFGWSKQLRKKKRDKLLKECDDDDELLILWDSQGATKRLPSTPNLIALLSGRTVGYFVNHEGIQQFLQWEKKYPHAKSFRKFVRKSMKTYMTTGRLVLEEQQRLLVEQLRFDLINSEQELVQTQEALEEANAEVNRRAFLVIKAAVEEWRLQNGYKNTDYDWRSSHLGECCAALRRIGYTKGSTLYVHAEYMENAHLAIKHIYDTHQRNPPSVCVPLNQLTLYSFLPIV